MVPLLVLCLLARGLATPNPDYSDRHYRARNMWDPIIDEMSILPDSERVEEAPVTPFHPPSNASALTQNSSTLLITTTTTTISTTAATESTTIMMGNVTDLAEVNMNDTKADKVIMTDDVLDQPTPFSVAATSFKRTNILGQTSQRFPSNEEYQNQIEYENDNPNEIEGPKRPQFRPQGPINNSWPRRYQQVESRPKRPLKKAQKVPLNQTVSQHPVITKTEIKKTDSLPSDGEQVKKAVQIDIFPDELAKNDERPSIPKESALNQSNYEPAMENPDNESIVITINKTQHKEHLLSNDGSNEQKPVINMTQNIVPQDDPNEVKSPNVLPIRHSFSNRMLGKQIQMPIYGSSYYDFYPDLNIQYLQSPQIASYPSYEQYQVPQPRQHSKRHKPNTYPGIKFPLYNQLPQRQLRTIFADYDYRNLKEHPDRSHANNRYGLGLRRSLRRPGHQMAHQRHSSPEIGGNFPLSERVTQKEESANHFKPISPKSSKHRNQRPWNSSKGIFNFNPHEVNEAILSSISKAGLSSNGIQVETKTDGGLSKASSHTFSFVQPNKVFNQAASGSYRNLQLEPQIRKWNEIESGFVPIGKVCLDVGYVSGTTKLLFKLPTAKLDKAQPLLFSNKELNIPGSKIEGSSSNLGNHWHLKKIGPRLNSGILNHDDRNNIIHSNPQIYDEIPQTMNLGVSEYGEPYLQPQSKSPQRLNSNVLDQVIDDYNGGHGTLLSNEFISKNDYNDFYSKQQGGELIMKIPPISLPKKPSGNSEDFKRKLMDFIMRKGLLELQQHQEERNPNSIPFDPTNQFKREVTDQVRNRMNVKTPGSETDPISMEEEDHPLNDEIDKPHEPQEPQDTQANKWNKVNAILSKAEQLLNSIEKEK